MNYIRTRLLLVALAMGLAGCQRSAAAPDKAVATPSVTAMSSTNPQPAANDAAPDARLWQSPSDASSEAALLIRRWYAANESCRGEPTAALSDPACAKRDRLDTEIEALGWCYGVTATSGADSEWERCAQRPASSDTSEPVLAEQSPPTIRYDPVSASQRERFRIGMSTSRDCVYENAKGLIQLGERDRDLLADRLASICARPLRIMSTLSEEQIQAILKPIAYGAIAAVEREGGG